MEVTFSGPARCDVRTRRARRAGRAATGDRTSRAHRSGPRRSVVADELAARGWMLQVNATSLTGRHGPEPEELGWSLLERGLSAARRLGRAPHDTAGASRRGVPARGASGSANGRCRCSTGPRWALRRHGLHLAQRRQAPERLQLDLPLRRRLATPTIKETRAWLASRISAAVLCPDRRLCTAR